jgi:hypothetical protein
LLDWFRSTFLSIMPSNNKPQAPLPLYGSGPTEPDPPKPEPEPKTKMQTTQNPFQPFNMSAEQGLAIAERAPKGKLLQTLTQEFKRLEDEREGKAKTPTKQTKSMLLTQADYQKKVAKLESELKAIGGTPNKAPRQGDKPGYFQSNMQNHLRDLEKQIAQRKSPQAAIRPAASAPAASSTLSAQSIASALIDEQERRAAAALVKTREQFTAMSPADCMKFCKAGGRIVN